MNSPRIIATVTVVALIAATSVPAWADDAVLAANHAASDAASNAASARVTVALTAPAPVVTTPPPVITPLKLGQVAPYPGVLFSPSAVGQIIAQQDTAMATLQLSVQHQATIDADQQKFALDAAATTCTTDKSIFSAQLTDAQKQNLILQDELKRESSGPGAGTWIGLGVVGGIVLTVVTAFAVGKL